MFDLPQEFIIYAVVGSLLPTIFWLWFWSRRDRFCPEPGIHIFGAFVFGALAALFTLPAQFFISAMFGSAMTFAMVLFVSAEEYIKYICCWYNSMHNNPYYNERIDPVTYLATTALGFSFLENVLYFLNYLNDFSLDIAVEEGGKRIIGATILHMVASATIGVFIAAVFFSTSKVIKALALITGLAMAILIHLGFNYLVSHTNQDYVLLAFGATWLLFIIILIAVEMLRSPTCPPQINWNTYDL